jgi:hypothetical protein
MPAAQDRDSLLARHGAMLKRAQHLASTDSERAAEAKRISNQLAEAFAWLSGAPSAEALQSAVSLLAQADERLTRLDS